MPVKTRITNKGTIDEKGASSFTIEYLGDSTNPFLRVNQAGRVQTGSLSQCRRYEWIEEGAGNQYISSSGYSVISVNGLPTIERRGLTSWSPGSSVFSFESVGDLFTIQYNALVVPDSGNPVLHIDFLLSGSDPTDLSISHRHHMSIERTVRTADDHTHIQGVFNIVADVHLVTSGAQLVGLTDGQGITIVSSSLLIKDG